MKIQIRGPGGRLTKPQRVNVEHRLLQALGRFSQRIDRVIVRFSAAEGIPGFMRCQLEVTVDVEVLRVEDSDINIFLALEHAAARAARSVGRAIERRYWSSDL
jgi:ribosome-associated translation inhibitor RaiA